MQHYVQNEKFKQAKQIQAKSSSSSNNISIDCVLLVYSVSLSYNNFIAFLHTLVAITGLREFLPHIHQRVYSQSSLWCILAIQQFLAVIWVRRTISAWRACFFTHLRQFCGALMEHQHKLFNSGLCFACYHFVTFFRWWWSTALVTNHWNVVNIAPVLHINDSSI